MDRIREFEEERQREQLDAEFVQKKTERASLMEARTMKNRNKRLKRKQSKKARLASSVPETGTDSEEETSDVEAKET